MAKKTRTTRKRNSQHRVPRLIRNNICSVSKTYFVGVIQQTSTSILTNTGGQQFQLNSCPDLVTMAGVYDQYRICAVKLRFVPGFRDSSGTTAAGQSGIIWTYWDANDASFPSNALEVMERKGYKVHNSVDKWSEYSKNIRVANSVYKTVATTGYSIAPRKMWLSTADQSIPHFGWKWFAENMQNYNFVNVYATLYVQFKDPK